MTKRIVWKIEKRKLVDLKPHPKNPRQFTEKGMKDLENSINSIGFMQPININQDGTILSGHARALKLKEMGETEVDVYVPDRLLTPKQEEEVLVRANANTAGQWDFDILANEFDIDEINDWGLEVPNMEVETEELEAKEDDFDAEPPVNPKTVLGDLYQIGEHRLLCGSSTESENWSKIFQHQLADMVMTDPPYNVNYEGGTGLKIMNDKMENDSFYQFLYDFYVALGLFTKKGGAWYVWHADSEGVNFRKAFKDSGLLLKQCLIWVKNALVMGRQDYHWKHEPCLYGWKEGAAHYFTNDRTKTTVIEDKIDLKKLNKKELLDLLKEMTSDKTKSTIIHCDKPIRNDVHPTMKPILLLAPLIQNSSKVGEIVADGFLGSGSTMVASHQLKRKCYGTELDPKYCDVIVKRMIKLDPSLKITRNGEDCKNEFIENND